MLWKGLYALLPLMCRMKGIYAWSLGMHQSPQDVRTFQRDLAEDAEYFCLSMMV